MEIADIDPPNTFIFALLLRFVRSRLTLSSSGAAALLQGMKTNVVPTQPRRNNKHAVVHNANVAEDTPSSVARNDTTLDTRNVTNANASPNGNDAARRHNRRVHEVK